MYVHRACGYTALATPTLCRMRSKFTPTFLCALLVAVAWSLLEEQKEFREPGTAVVIPGAELRIENYYEIKLENRDPDWVAIYHGGPQLHMNYEGRGEFLDNGSFILKNLTKNDGGVYIYYVNTKIHHKMELTVIDPMDHPVLNRIDRRDEDCLTRLECIGSGGNVSFYHNGVRVSDSVTKKGNVLHVEATRAESWGTYTCQLTNQAGVKYSSEVIIPNLASWQDLVAFYACMPVLVFKLILGICCVYACTATKRGVRSAHTEGGAAGDTLSKAVVKLEFGLLILCDFGTFLASFYFYQYNPYWPFLVSTFFVLIFLFRIMLPKLKCCRCMLQFVDKLLQVADYGTPALCLVVIILFYIQYRDFCSKRVYKSHWILLTLIIPVVFSLILFSIIYVRLKCRAGHNDSVANVGFTRVEARDSREKGGLDDLKALAEDLGASDDTESDDERSRAIGANDGTMLPGEHNTNECGPDSTIRYCERPSEDTHDEEGPDEITHPGNPTLFGEGSAGEPDTNG